ncbi:MAG: tRNA (adenosine(37)-N6)-threonylcarbamoyltransferase complex ATPase subunit type 1 TsaE, partial [Methylococcaceae bacterium]|nr:tRNA (adenosine(37)-N6)-threonylcarbamoyltransferase complex ATPase subunit type 1 TsaE [Methylococcaceae bacterium]
TYNLVEEYPLPDFTLYHFDLYRLTSPEELEWIGIDDYFSEDAVCFIEWPDKGAGFLPPANLEIHLKPENNGRLITISI